MVIFIHLYIFKLQNNNRRMDEYVNLCEPRMEAVDIALIDWRPNNPASLYNELATNFNNAFGRVYGPAKREEIDRVKRVINIEYPSRNSSGTLELSVQDLSESDLGWNVGFSGMNLISCNIPTNVKFAEIAYGTFLGSNLPISFEKVHPAVRHLDKNIQEYFVALQENFRILKGLPQISLGR